MNVMRVKKVRNRQWRVDLVVGKEELPSPRLLSLASLNSWWL